MIDLSSPYYSKLVSASRMTGLGTVSFSTEIVSSIFDNFQERLDSSFFRDRKSGMGHCIVAGLVMLPVLLVASYECS